MKIHKEYGLSVYDVAESDWAIRGSDVSKKISMFDFHFWDNFYIGIDICERQEQLRIKRKQLLAFTLHIGEEEIGSGRCSGRFAEIDGDIWLLHSGRVFSRDERSRPSSTNEIVLGNNKFFMVSKIDDQKFLANIAEFHSSRSSNKIELDSSEAYRANVGAQSGGVRSEAVWEAKHSPLTKKIYEFMRQKGWFGIDGSPWQPDILLRNSDGKTILVEVKPEATKHNAITALGQLLCYRTPHGVESVLCVLAAEGAIDTDVLPVLDGCGVKYIDLGADDWPVKLQRLCE